MIGIPELLWIVPFAMAVGFIFAEVCERYNRDKAEIKIAEKEKATEACGKGDPFPQETLSASEKKSETLDPMMLRNGYGVTRDRNPTFAEQWVNIMNYNGESQTEEGYEEKEDYSTEHMG